MNKSEILLKYLPEKSVKKVILLLDSNPCFFKIVNSRKTKHGDFRKTVNGNYQITVNNNLNKYGFLITLIHEIAHLVTYKQYRNIKPHGNEWKKNFQLLMLPFINPEIFPNEILPLLANYLKNPKASTDSDLKLSLILKQFDSNNDKHLIFEIPLHTKFEYNNKVFTKGNKRRTRHECIEIRSGKKYLFHANAEVNILN